MSRSGSYLYAIARGLTDGDLAAVAGLRGAPLRVVEHADLAAIVSTVDLDEFGDEALRQNLEDLDWLEQVARTHDSVVHAAAAQAPTAPLRLVTICFDDDAVRARLAEWEQGLRRTLHRIEGRREWSVKAFASSARTSSPPEPDTAGTGAGAAYLMRRKAETAQRASAAGAAAELADELHAALAQRSVAGRRLPAQDRQLSGHDAAMTLNGAYLVDDAAAADFAATARALSAEHPDAKMIIQGPWPPYSFARMDDG